MMCQSFVILNLNLTLMEYYLLALWFYFMLHVTVKIYTAQTLLNQEIKKGNPYILSDENRK